MTISAAQFKASFPEMRHVGDALIEDAIARAERRLSPTTFPAEIRGDVVALQAARILADSPMGQQASLQLESGRTIYDDQLNRLKRSYTMGFRVP